MARYIDAEKFKHIINNSKMYGTVEWHDVLEMLMEVPTADVVEVIRCKDCANWQIDWIPTIGGDKGCHYCEIFVSSTEPLNYCGYAERREYEV